MPRSLRHSPTNQIVTMSRKLPTWTGPEGLIPEAQVKSSRPGWSSIKSSAILSAQCIFSTSLLAFLDLSAVHQAMAPFSDRLSIRANPSRISFIIAASFALSDLIPRSTAAKRDSTVFLGFLRAIDRFPSQQVVGLSRLPSHCNLDSSSSMARRARASPGLNFKAPRNSSRALLIIPLAA